MAARALVMLATLCALSADRVGADDLTWSAANQRTSLAEGNEFMLLSGNAKIRSGSMEIEADEIEATGKNSRYIYCRGSVRVSDPERGIRLQSASLFYDRELEITRIDGYSELIDLTNDVVVKGGFLEYLGQEELIVIQIGVRILKVTDESEITCRAEFARYEREKNLLELTGVPRVTRNEDEYSASRILINLDTDEIILEDGVRGRIVDTGEPDGSSEAR
jgi:lipopolysaccharide export system protein LptA